MKPFFLACFCCTCLAWSGLAQTSGATLLRHYRQTLPFEKLYLHTDQRIYAPGDALWFRAYLADDYNRPIYTTESKIQVQLLDPAGKVINEFNLEILPEQLANHILIPVQAEVGIYTLRATTPWLFNFGQDAFFEQKVLVWPHDLPYPIAEDTLVQHASPVQIQFFPEGGDLVADFSQKVAFKSYDNEGKSREIKGTLYNNQHEQVLNFASFHQGMGSFNLTPQVGERYYALLERQKDTFWLPVCRMDELALRLELPQKDSLGLTLWKRSAEMAQVLLRCKDSIVWQQKWLVSKGETRLKIPIVSLPIGIAQVIVLDEKERPYAERLVFLHRERQAQVKLKTTYQVSPSETIVDIEAYDEQGKPLEGILSLAVVEDQHWQMWREQPDHILSRFLLSAELKGKIADPTFYFRLEEPKAPAALDLVMLCHGWRKFAWKEIQAIASQGSKQLVAYPRMWEIRGRLIMGEKNLLPKSKIYLEGQKAFIRPDSLGKFKLVLPVAQVPKPPTLLAKFRHFRTRYAEVPLLLPPLPWPNAKTLSQEPSSLLKIPDSLEIFEFLALNKLKYRPRKPQRSEYEADPRPATFGRAAGVSIISTPFGRDLSLHFGDDLFLGSNAAFHYFTFYFDLERELRDLKQKESLYERVFAALPGSANTGASSPAQRRTLYWAPQVGIKNGQGKLSFNTAAKTGTYRIIAEGLASQGMVMHAQLSYWISKAE